MTSCRSAEDAILADDQLLYTVRCSYFCDELRDFRVPVPSISPNDQSSSLCTFRDGQYDACNKGFAVVLLLEDLDLLSKAGAMTISCSVNGRWGVTKTYVPGF